MGNTNEPLGHSENSKQIKGFLEKVEKISSGESQIWGNYSIYQQQQKPYDYFLEYMHFAHFERDFLLKKLAFYKNMPKHKNLVPVQYVEIVKQKQLCAQFDVLRVFCMYYNFTLQDGIKVKIRQRNCFTEGELVYILRSLLLIGRYYESQLKARCYSGIFQSREVFISPQGHLKIYPFNDNIFSSYIKMTDKLKKDTDKDGGPHRMKQGKDVDKIDTKRMEQRKGRIRTTLKHQNSMTGNSLTGSFTQQQSKIKSEESPLNSMRGKAQQHYLASSRSINKLSEPQEMRRNGSGRDWFQLGILMMQLILLNDSQEYYYEESVVENHVQAKKNRNLIGLSKTVSTVEFSHSKSSQQYLGYALMYQNNQGKKPNLDLIHFSLNNLLPKKHISQTLLQIITLLFSPNHQNLTYGQLITTLQQHQQTLNEPKYCLKFDVQNQNQEQPQISDKHFSRCIVKNQSIDPLLKTTNLSSRAFINNDSFSSLNYQSKFMTQSKESFFAKNLDDLVNVNNLTRSMIIEEGEDNNKSAVLLNGLKKSRKLVPSKIRSVSNRNSDISHNNLSKSKKLG